MRIITATIAVISMLFGSTTFATDNSDCPAGEVVSCFADGGCFCAKDNPKVEPDPGSAPDCDDADDNGVCD